MDHEGGTTRTGGSGDGPETVRILGEEPVAEGEGEWFVERPVVRSGTLYTRVPADHEQAEPAGAGTRALEVAQQNAPEATRTHVTQVRKGPSACAILAATFSLLLLSCAVLAFATFRDGLDGLGRLGGLIPSFPSIVTTPTVTIDTSRPAVVDRVRALGRLETVHYELEKVVSGKSSGPLPDFLTSDKILLVAHGSVVAGLDLAKLKPDDITVISDTVTIRLPDAEVLFSKLDNDKTYVYDRETGIFSKPDPNLETQIRRAAEQEILNAALEDGILARAEENARDVLRTLITGLGYKEVTFTEGP